MTTTNEEILVLAATGHFKLPEGLEFYHDDNNLGSEGVWRLGGFGKEIKESLAHNLCAMEFLEQMPLNPIREMGSTAIGWICSLGTGQQGIKKTPAKALIHAIYDAIMEELSKE